MAIINLLLLKILRGFYHFCHMETRMECWVIAVPCQKRALLVDGIGLLSCRIRFYSTEIVRYYFRIEASTETQWIASRWYAKEKSAAMPRTCSLVGTTMCGYVYAHRFSLYLQFVWMARAIQMPTLIWAAARRTYVMMTKMNHSNLFSLEGDPLSIRNRLYLNK